MIGRSGTGKTSLMRDRLVSSNRALVFDILRNFHPGVVCRDKLELWEYLNKQTPKFRVLYQPSFDMANLMRVKAEADYICLLARACSPVEVFVDEVDAFCDVNDVPPNLDILMRYGRNIDITIRAACRRPKAVIPKHLITECTRFCIFRTVDPMDSKYLEDYTGIPAEQIQALPLLHYFEWNEGQVSRKQVIIPGFKPPRIGEAQPVEDSTSEIENESEDESEDDQAETM